MKYFRKHPDVIIITNFPKVSHRVRHGRQTTPQQYSKILVRTIVSALKGAKKTLILTDAPVEKPHAGTAVQTAWATGKPYTLIRLINGIIYNHKTDTICILFHPELFGKPWTDLILPGLILFFRLIGKKVVLIFLITPKLPPLPSLLRTTEHFIRLALLSFMVLLSQTVIAGDKPFANHLTKLSGKTITPISLGLQSLKERRGLSKFLYEKIFPSPLQDLGLINMLKKNSLA